MLLSNEIKEWRAVLRHSNFLLKHQSPTTAFNIYGEELHIDMLNFAANIKAKRLCYWEERIKEKKLQNIVYPSMNVFLDFLDETKELSRCRG